MAKILLVVVCIIIFSSLMISASAAEDPSEEQTSCEADASGGCYDKNKATKLKVIAIFSILISSMIGIGLPMFSRSLTAVQPDTNLFVIIKSLASGVILSTGFMHVLPDSWNDLTSECLPEKPWREFPVTTFVTMVTAVSTMLMDSVATSYFQKKGMQQHGHGHGHGHGHHHGVGGGGGDVAIHSHVSPPAADEGMELEMGTKKDELKSSQLMRYRIVAQVLEVGIVVHSVVIGLSMGVSNNPCTIRPLVVAMCFHQMLEGMGLGGCILQAEYKFRMKFVLATFFSITTPFGIALGMGLLNVYNQNSPGALIVVGLLNAISSGLLIYMALVDLLAADFMGPKLQASIKLQLKCFAAICLGMASMSLMAKWA